MGRASSLPLPGAVWLAFAAFHLSACGSDNAGMNPGGAGGSRAGAAGASGSAGLAGASASGGAGANGGASASGGASANGGGGNCTGDFGAPVTVVAQADGVRLGSPTLSPDQRELIFTRITDTESRFVHSLRSALSDPFPTAVPFPELDAACQGGDSRTADLSADGLRAYITCYDETQMPVLTSLRIADRASLTSGFSVRATTASLIGPSAAISHDELTLYSNGPIMTGTVASMQYTRASSNDAFGPGGYIPGLSSFALYSVDPSPDGLALYGQYSSSLAVSTRGSVGAAFETPSVLLQAASGGSEVFGAPEISQDCRSLYFVHLVSTAGVSSSSISVLRR